MDNINKSLNNNYLNDIIAINLGYYNTKIKHSNKLYIYKSQVCHYVDEDISKTITIDNIRYVIGDGREDLSLDKSKSDTQNILLKYALSKFPSKNKKVIVALPINTYINKEARTQYRNFVLSQETVSDCICYMESASLVFSNYEWFKNKYTLLMDVGGATINFSLYDNGNLVKGFAYSEMLGTYILNDRIKTAIEQSELCTINSQQIKYLMDKPCVKKVLNDYIKEIKNSLSKHNFPLTNINICGTGGGCIDFKELFVSNFNAIILPDDLPLYQNVNGLYEIARRYWNND